MLSVIMVNVAVPLFVFGILKLCLHWRNFIIKNAYSSIIMLCLVIQSDIMLSVAMLSAVILSLVTLMLNVSISVITPSVAAPRQQ
jgi:hypothetical protein